MGWAENSARSGRAVLHPLAYSLLPTAKENP